MYTECDESMLELKNELFFLNCEKERILEQLKKVDCDIREVESQLIMVSLTKTASYRNSQEERI